MLLISFKAAAQEQLNRVYVKYINEFKDIAVQQMKQYGIPASITLAQGLLESGAGTSRLAVNSNNHFGIKCGSNWKGKTFTHFDDGRWECFRSYENPDESYKDHSVFLLRDRYKPLFKLSKTDYKGWAKGLKDCGYATSPTYAKRLITIIETYHLYEYDKTSTKEKKPKTESQSQRNYQVAREEIINSSTSTVFEERKAIVYPNGLHYITAQPGDTWKTLSLRYDISEKKLRAFNEYTKEMPLYAGDVVYLEKKKTKASKDQIGDDYWHHIKGGESMHSISQQYGIQMKSLYKMNFRKADYVPQPGDLLKVR